MNQHENSFKENHICTTGLSQRVNKRTKKPQKKKKKHFHIIGLNPENLIVPFGVSAYNKKSCTKEDSSVLHQRNYIWLLFTVKCVITINISFHRGISCFSNSSSTALIVLGFSSWIVPAKSNRILLLRWNYHLRN